MDKNKTSFTAILDKTKDAFKHFGKYMLERIKKFSPTQWIGMVCMLLVGIFCFLMAIMWSIDMANGIAFFPGPEVDGEVGDPMTSYEVGALIVFYILGLGCIGMTIYEFFFMEIRGRKPGNRDIIRGRVVDLDQNILKKEQGDAQNKDDSQKK